MVNRCNGGSSRVRLGGWRQGGLDQAVQACKVFDLAFPDDNHAPPKGPKLFSGALVAGDVSSKLRLPEVASGLGHDFAVTTSVTMPVAAVNKDYCIVLGQHDVRFPGELLSVQPEPITEPMHSPSNDQFGLCVLSADPGHVETALLRCENVRHQLMPESFRKPYTDAAILDAMSGGTAFPT